MMAESRAGEADLTGNLTAQATKLLATVYSCMNFGTKTYKVESGYSKLARDEGASVAGMSPVFMTGTAPTFRTW